MKDKFAKIAENVAEVRGRMADAAARSGRAAGDVTLVAVTKFVPTEVIRLLIETGCRDLGESRPQHLWEKAAALGDFMDCTNFRTSEKGTEEVVESNPSKIENYFRQPPPSPLPRGRFQGIRWHLIGHLQRNKARRTLPLVAMIHSVDSPRLLAALEEEIQSWGGRDASIPNSWGGRDVSTPNSWGGRCTATPEPTPIGSAVQLPPQPNIQLPPQHRPLPVLLEVNISREVAKHGFTPEEIEPFLAELPQCQNVSIRGLMCMASLEGGPDEARRDFAALRQLRDRLRLNCPPGVTLGELSMGMSGDFEAAIEEGATIVRVGSALFEGIPNHPM
jgi:PLP dependent protein